MLPLEIQKSGGAHLNGKMTSFCEFKVPKTIQIEIPERQVGVQICRSGAQGHLSYCPVEEVIKLT